MFNEIELRRFDLNLLTVFAVLMSERSASRAAQKLGIGGPAVSMALKRLRTELRDPLFIRVGTEFKPTARAVELMRAFGPALEQIYAGMKGSNRFDPASTHRTFRVGCSDDIDLILSPRLARSALSSRETSRFVMRRTDFHTSPILLERDEIDLVIGVVNNLPKWLNNAVVSTHGLLCLVDAKHVDTSRKLSLQSYLELPHVVVSLVGNLQGVLDEAFSALHVRRYVAHSTAHFSVIPSILKQGPSIATLPSYVVREFSQTYGLSILEPPFDFGSFEVHVVWHRKNENDRGHRWLRNHVISLLKESLGRDLKRSKGGKRLPLAKRVI
jgi:LysR family transcriptional activator of mexEF-oprN operon